MEHLPPRAQAERFAHASSDAEIFCEPSTEAHRLLRHLGALTTPPGGRGSLPWRTVRAFLVAPISQLTFLSFDLQMFLFDVFHTTLPARVGHFVGMTAVNLLALALLVQATGTPWSAVVVAASLLGWYAAMARATRLALWWAVMVVVLGGIAFGACTLAAAATPHTLRVALFVAGLALSLSHSFEPLFPPRAGDPLRWVPIRTFVLGDDGARNGVARSLLRALRVGMYPFIGMVGEMWASPRLLPYNVLRAMLRVGYAPALRAELDDRARRALASGNPALDYVGIGGGTFLAPPHRTAPTKAT